MKIVNYDQMEKEPFHTPLFTGEDVTRQVLLPESKELQVNNVSFGKGIRTKFHAHSTEQILIVTSGRGIVATEDTESTVTVGDVIFIPAGEKHCHGAAADSEFSHIYIFGKDNKTTQLED
jgi:quercetin dioxygenase-like cupin family protein